MSGSTQQYYNGAYMEENFHDITTKIRQRKKPTTSTDKEGVQGSFKKKTPKNNTTHTLLYSNIYEFAGNLEGILNVHYVGLIV